MPSPLTKYPDGTVEWVRQDGDQYLVTGVDRNGKRFRRGFPSFHMARCLNAWQGNIWLVRDGRRYRIQRINN